MCECPRLGETERFARLLFPVQVQLALLSTMNGRAPGLLDLVTLVEADVDAATAAVNVRELLTGLPHHGRVDDRHHLVDVLEYQTKKESLVSIVETGQENELLEIGRLGLEVFVRSLQLLLDGADGWRKEAPKIELVPLTGRERRTPIRKRVDQKRSTPLSNGHVLLPSRRIGFDREGHERLQFRGGRPIDLHRPDVSHNVDGEPQGVFPP